MATESTIRIGHELVAQATELVDGTLVSAYSAVLDAKVQDYSVPVPKYAYLNLPGEAGDFASVPDHADFRIVGDLDLRIAVALTDWTPAAVGALLGRRASGTDVSYFLRMASNGRPALVWTENGSSNKVASANAAPTVTNGSLLLLRVTLDVDNEDSGNDVKHYTKASTYEAAHGNLLLHDGWTQLGTTITTVNTTSIHAGESDVEIGSVTGGTENLLIGKVIAVAIYEGIAGTKVLDVDFSRGPVGVITLADLAGGHVVTVNQSGDTKAEILGGF